MPDRVRTSVYAIGAQRGFADVLASGLLGRFGKDPMALARVTLLIPNHRAGRAITEALVRHAANGLLLPRMALIGDLDLDESLGALLDPLGEGEVIPPAVDPLERRFRLAAIIAREGARRPGAQDPAEALRLANEYARVLDQLQVEEKTLDQLDAVDVEADLADHWAQARDLFLRVGRAWALELAAEGKLDPAERRNRLLRKTAEHWQASPPAAPVIAAGITTSAPAIARLLRSIAHMRQGRVVLPGLDLEMDAPLWEAIGEPVPVTKPGEAPPAERPAITHPQYHLKQLLGVMSVSRAEVEPWLPEPKTGLVADRARLLRSILLPARLSDRWVTLPAADRRTKGIRIIEAADPDEEAQTIALLVRQALDVPARRVAIVTPDRTLAARIIAHLKRWNVEADDSAGEALPVTPPGRFLLAIANCLADDFAPVALLDLLKHPLAQAGDGRLGWLEHVRALDMRLRGPRPAPGLTGIDASIGKPELRAWWEGTKALLAPIARFPRDPQPLSSVIEAVVATADALSNQAVWNGIAGRSASDLIQQLLARSTSHDPLVTPAQAVTILSRLMAEKAVRPPFGKHPRVAIYGLLEARLQSSDLVICSGLNEGVWPQIPSPDPWLAPMVRNALGLPPLEMRVGLAAQDLAGALASPEVVLTRAMRDGSAPTVASRFLLRLQAVASGKDMEDPDALALARALDRRMPKVSIDKPAPRPSRSQRAVKLSVTELDRLRADPFAFYAKRIMALRSLDPIDAEPSAAWRGILVHEILELWHKHDHLDPVALVPRANQFLAKANVHPLIKALWRPRLVAGLEWVVQQTLAHAEAGRRMIDAERSGSMLVDGVKISGKADRIDRMPDGTLVVVDYKTGKPPSAAQVQTGFALQLGLLGMIAQRGGFNEDPQLPPISGTASDFEYWSLTRHKDSDTGFGYVDSPVLKGRKKSGLPADQIIPTSEQFLREALANWIMGDAPFEAKLVPDHALYTEYDQLMRLAEWYGRQGARA
ncbi:PD-(D/E)XK nuclease family protein [Blastomonas aquatica]|uniref:Double-strand break repair protein AddB n=1 Tax=Blastomonas aquatica TaxID=1510276 RepID=A0ABQ1JH76_9SPHN|nr:PD-(D/E)XK nuclease family protein [Blastomonas aquatica]GGB66472.1 double-strand break repair protein AddB [Blastomonas aquatica]